MESVTLPAGFCYKSAFTTGRRLDENVYSRRGRRMALFLFLCVVTASAQMPRPTQPPPPFTSAPTIEDRNLYYAFFIAQQAILTANQAARTANPSAAQQVDQQAAATLHIAVQELPVV